MRHQRPSEDLVRLLGLVPDLEVTVLARPLVGGVSPSVVGAGLFVAALAVVARAQD